MSEIFRGMNHISPVGSISATERFWSPPLMKPKRVLRMDTRAMMRERGLQPRSSNYTGERVTRDEGLKREVVRRQFHFQFPVPFVWYRLRA